MYWQCCEKEGGGSACIISQEGCLVCCRKSPIYPIYLEFCTQSKKKKQILPALARVRGTPENTTIDVTRLKAQSDAKRYILSKLPSQNNGDSRYHILSHVSAACGGVNLFGFRRRRAVDKPKKKIKKIKLDTMQAHACWKVFLWSSKKLPDGWTIKKREISPN